MLNATCISRLFRLAVSIAILSVLYLWATRESSEKVVFLVDNLEGTKEQKINFALILLSPTITSLEWFNNNWSHNNNNNNHSVLFKGPISKWNTNITNADCCHILDDQTWKQKFQDFEYVFCYATMADPDIPQWMWIAMERFITMFQKNDDNSILTANNDELWPLQISNDKYSFHGSDIKTLQYFCKESPRNSIVSSTLKLGRNVGLESIIRSDVEIEIYYRQSLTTKLINERQAILNELYGNYFKKKAKQMEDFYNGNGSSGDLKFVSLSCQLNSGWCGGLGDRLRGSPAVFYTALHNDAVFVAEQNKPIEIDKFYKLNNVWYNVSSKVLKWTMEYQKNRTKQSDEEKYAENRRKLEIILDSNETSYYHSMPGAGPSDLAYVAHLVETSNSSKGGSIHKYLPDFLYKNRFFLTEFVSATFEMIMGDAQPRLVSLAETLIGKYGFDWQSWNAAIKIGVQIRFNRHDNEWRESPTTVTRDQLPCFVDKIKIIIINLGKKRPKSQAVVFVTSDVDTVSAYFKQHLKELATVIDSSYIHRLYNLQTMHLDRSKFSSDDPDRLWYEASTSYLDVYILGKLMDFLVISYSGFSKIASRWSLKPAWIFKHSIRDSCQFQTEIF